MGYAGTTTELSRKRTTSSQTLSRLRQRPATWCKWERETYPGSTTPTTRMLLPASALPGTYSEPARQSSAADTAFSLTHSRTICFLATCRIRPFMLLHLRTTTLAQILSKRRYSMCLSAEALALVPYTTLLAAASYLPEVLHPNVTSSPSTNISRRLTWKITT